MQTSKTKSQNNSEKEDTAEWVWPFWRSCIWKPRAHREHTCLLGSASLKCLWWLCSEPSGVKGLQVRKQTQQCLLDFGALRILSVYVLKGKKRGLKNYKICVNPLYLVGYCHCYRKQHTAPIEACGPSSCILGRVY